MQRSLIPAALLAAGAAAPALANSDGPTGRQVQVEIVFLWKQLPVWRLNVNAVIKADRYRVTTQGKAVGLAWSLTRFTSNSMVEGRISGRQIQPLRYNASSKFRSRNSNILLTYPEPGRTVTKITPLKSNEDWTPVPNALRQGAPDPLSAIVANLRPTAAKPCSWSGEVYDGRRRYRLSFQPDGMEVLKSSTWNRFAGKAFRCKVVSKTLAGFYTGGKGKKPKKTKPRPPTVVWFARVKGSKLWLPVKLRGSTPWGKVRGELFRYKVSSAK